MMMNRKLLVVDDENEILDLMERFFSKEDVVIETAGSVNEAQKKIKASFFPVIITDMSFPGRLSGMDVLKAARERAAETEVIVITGYGSINNAVEAMKMGAYDYITKPFDLDEVKKKVSRIFEIKEMEDKMADMHESIMAIEDSAGTNISQLEKMVHAQEQVIKEAGQKTHKLKQQLSSPSPAVSKLMNEIINLLKTNGRDAENSKKAKKID